MYILDTNVVSELMAARPDEAVLRWFDGVSADDLWVTSITKAELLYGLEVLPQGRKRDMLAGLIRDVLDGLIANEVLPFADAEASFYAAIAARRRAAGRSMEKFDAQIAAIARSRNLKVVTRNVSDFEDCGIGLINPWEDG